MTHKYDLPFLACDGHEIDTLALLGEGGSKTVLEVSVDGMRRAIAIPNSADTPDVREKVKLLI